jgi:predicted HTH transcriptional regulator
VTNSHLVVISGLQRTVRLPYPVQALREALVNAVVHGLYANMRSNIDYLVMHVYPTRIEIRNRCSSAAKPYSLVWFANVSVPANPFLMNTLRKCRDEQGKPMFAEAFGMGKRLIISSCAMHGDPVVCNPFLQLFYLFFYFFIFYNK